HLAGRLADHARHDQTRREAELLALRPFKAPVRAAAARKELLDERVLQTEPRAGQALDEAVAENGGVARTFGGFERLGDRAEHELARDCLLLVAAVLARRKMLVESTATLCVATTLAAAPARKLKLRVHLLPRRIEVDAQVRERR